MCIRAPLTPLSNQFSPGTYLIINHYYTSSFIHLFLLILISTNKPLKPIISLLTHSNHHFYSFFFNNEDTMEQCLHMDKQEQERPSQWRESEVIRISGVSFLILSNTFLIKLIFLVMWYTPLSLPLSPLSPTLSSSLPFSFSLSFSSFSSFFSSLALPFSLSFFFLFLFFLATFYCLNSNNVINK